jgi:hypothetical protein
VSVPVSVEEAEGELPVVSVSCQWKRLKESCQLSVSVVSEEAEGELPVVSVSCQ